MFRFSPHSSTSRAVKLRNLRRNKRSYLPNRYTTNVNNNFSTKQASNNAGEEEASEKVKSMKVSSAYKKKVDNEHEYSARIMELYPLGFNPISDIVGSGSKEAEGEGEEDQNGEQISVEIDDLNPPKRKKFTTPRKKRKPPLEETSNSNRENEKMASLRESALKRASANNQLEGPNKLASVKQLSIKQGSVKPVSVKQLSVKQGSVKQGSVKAEQEQMVEPNLEEEEEEEEEEQLEEPVDDSDRFPCIYNVWVKDCCRSRRDFVYCQQLDLTEIGSKDEFQKIMYAGGFLNSVDDYDYFFDCLRTSPNRTIQGVEAKFGLEIDVSDAFYGRNGNRLRAYSFQGRDRKSVFSAYNYFRSTWTADMTVHSLQDCDEPFRPDDWFENILMVDRDIYGYPDNSGQEEMESSDEEEGENLQFEDQVETAHPKKSLKDENQAETRDQEPKGSQKVSIKQSMKEPAKDSVKDSGKDSGKESVRQSLKQSLKTSMKQSMKQSVKSKSVKGQNRDDDSESDSNTNQSNLLKKANQTGILKNPQKEKILSKNNDNVVPLNTNLLGITERLESMQMSISEESQIEDAKIAKDKTDNRPNSNPNNSDFDKISCDPTTVSEIQSNYLYITNKNENKLKNFMNYLKYPADKLRKIIPKIMKFKGENEANKIMTENSSCTISNMVKLLDANNNKMSTLNSPADIQQITELMKTKFKIVKYIIDDHEVPIPVWKRLDEE